MDHAQAVQYVKRLEELSAELRDATTPELRAPVLARMHNLLFPLHVVDTYAAQHLEESFGVLRRNDVPLVMAAYGTIAASLERLRETLKAHPVQEPFVVYGESERVFAKPVTADELAFLHARGRLVHEKHDKYLTAIEVTPAVKKVLRDADPDVLLPALARIGFPNTGIIALFSTKAHPKIGRPAEKMPSLKLCTMRGGIPITITEELHYE